MVLIEIRQKYFYIIPIMPLQVYFPTEIQQFVAGNILLILHRFTFRNLHFFFILKMVLLLLIIVCNWLNSDLMFLISPISYAGDYDYGCNYTCKRWKGKTISFNQQSFKAITYNIFFLWKNWLATAKQKNCQAPFIWCLDFLVANANESIIRFLSFDNIHIIIWLVIII